MLAQRKGGFKASVCTIVGWVIGEIEFRNASGLANELAYAKFERLWLGTV